MNESRRQILLDTPHTETATGAIASFETDMVGRAKEVKVEIEAVQDLHGHDHPWPGGGSANLLGGEKLAENINEVCNTVWDKTNKTIRITTNANKLPNDRDCFFTTGITFEENTQYTLIIAGTISGYANTMFRYTDGTDDRQLGRGIVVGANVSIAGKTVAGVVYRSYSGSTTLNYENCGLFKGLVTVGDFVPYSNICPISGWTGANVQRTGKNLLNPNYDDYAQTYAYNYILGVVPQNALARFTFTDKDTTIDVSGCNIGFVWEDVSANVQVKEYRWAVSNGSIQSDTSNQSGRGVLCGNVFIYPRGKEAFDKLFARWNIMVELGSTATSYEPYQGSTTPISWADEAGTVYGGTLTWEKDGTVTLTKTMEGVDLGTLNWAGTGATYFTAEVNINVPSVTQWATQNGMCSIYTIQPMFYIINSAARVNNSIAWYPNYIRVADSAYENPASFKAAMSGVQLVYELATPVAYTLTPQEALVFLRGTNNVWNDINDTTVTYWTHKTGDSV